MKSLSRSCLGCISLALLLSVVLSCGKDDADAHADPDAGAKPQGAADASQASNGGSQPGASKDAAAAAGAADGAAALLADSSVVNDAGRTQDFADASQNLSDAATLVTADGCPLADNDFAISGSVDGILHRYDMSPVVVAINKTHLSVTMGVVDRWRLTLPNAAGDYDCGEVADETAVEHLSLGAFATSFGEKASCAIHLQRVEGFIRGSFQGTLASLDEKSMYPAAGCFNVPNGGTLAGPGLSELNAGTLGAFVEVTKGNDVVETGTNGVLDTASAGDQRAMEQLYASFTGSFGVPPMARSVSVLGLPYAAGTYVCGAQPTVAGNTLFATVELTVNVGAAYRAATGSGNCQIQLSYVEPNFEATYSGTFVSGEKSIDAAGELRFRNPKVL